jgi:hypothetical protein
MENEFFIGLPQGKTEGICQIDIDKDSSSIVDILTKCRVCPIGKCVMFETILDKEGKVIGRKFIKHSPEYVLSHCFLKN